VPEAAEADMMRMRRTGRMMRSSSNASDPVPEEDPVPVPEEAEAGQAAGGQRDFPEQEEGPPSPDGGKTGGQRDYAMALTETKFKEVLHLARELSEQPNEDATPYKTKYEARDLLQNLQSQMRAASDESEEGDLLKERVAIVDSLLGANFIDCEENADGEKSLKAALATLAPKPRVYLSVLQEILNSLGVLWSSREEYPKARDFLLQSKDLFTQHAGALSAKSWKGEKGENQCQHNYTMTLYFLAQVQTRAVHTVCPTHPTPFYIGNPHEWQRLAAWNESMSWGVGTRHY
jgi:hypothetical protein